MRQIYFVYFLVCIITFVGCHPRLMMRGKRQERDSDYNTMEKYWHEEIPLGFFVNQGAALESGGDSGATTRSKIEKIETEGSGEVKRDDIEPKPTSSITINKGEGKVANDEKISTEESGKLQAKLEKTPTETEKADPGDKTKARNTVTCQGQKEWLQCDGPYELIKIKNAFWGRDNDFTCTKSGVAHGLKTDKICAQDESNTINKVKEACDNENVCEVVASGIYFDKADCGDIYKYLRMEWECAPSESRIKETIS